MSYAVCLCKVCIDHICKAFTRIDLPQDPERWKAAKRMVKAYPFLDVCELVDFEEKFTDSLIPIRRNGQDDYSIRVLDRNAIMERLGSYVRNFRPKFEEPSDSNFGLPQVAVPLGARNDYQRHHMPDGTPVNGPWDADRCWQDFKRTHNYNFTTHSYEYIGERSLEEAIAYWEERPTKEEIQSVNGGADASIVAEALAFQFAPI